MIPSVSMILIIIALLFTIYEMVYANPRTLLHVSVLLICVALLVSFVK
jgi:hypothetical protein